MTKAKVIEDLRKHCSDSGFYAWLGDGYAWYINGYAAYRDIEPLSGFEYDIEQKLKNPKILFKEADEGRLKRIDIDKDILKTFIKAHRRNSLTSLINQFKINYKGGLIVVDPWLLQNMCEYIKDYAIYIDENWNGYPKICYKAPLWGFSSDFLTIQCLTLPINVTSEDTAKVCIENADMEVIE